MGKATKEHRKKVQARKARIEAERKSAEKKMKEAYDKYVENIKAQNAAKLKPMGSTGTIQTAPPQTLEGPKFSSGN